jgi:hypothetical protein
MTLRAPAVGFLVTALAPWNGVAAQQFEVIYSFCSQQNCADGSRPAAGLIMDEHGALYGTTNWGGGRLPVDFETGTVFKLTPPATKSGAWTEAVLYRFCSLAQCSDGFAPFTRLLLDRGALFGTTSNGGANDSGAAFKLTPPATTGNPWTYTLLYSFCSLANCADGYGPAGNLIMDQRGALYGVTRLGPGTNRGGTIYKLTPPSARRSTAQMVTTCARAYSWTIKARSTARRKVAASKRAVWHSS